MNTLELLAGGANVALKRMRRRPIEGVLWIVFLCFFSIAQAHAQGLVAAPRDPRLGTDCRVGTKADWDYSESTSTEHLGAVVFEGAWFTVLFATVALSWVGRLNRRNLASMVVTAALISGLIKYLSTVLSAIGLHAP